MHDVDRHDNVARHENDTVMSREPLAAEPLPVDEAGLESGEDTARHTRPDHVPAQETAPGHDTDGVGDGVHMDRDADGVPMDRDADEAHMDRDADGVHMDRDADGVHMDRDADVAQEGVPAAVPGTVRDQETAQGQDTELFTDDAVTRLRARWRELQADFVDDPERAVREADEVVDEVVRTITDHRERLSGEWQGHTDTEHLRLAMREYRTFVDRLLPT